MKKITLNDELAEKDMLLGFCLMYPAPGIVEKIGADWDWIWIDMQHGQHDYNSSLQCVRACELVSRPSVIRVPSHDYGFIGMALDTCASGVMVPMVNTAEQASAIVQAGKFPPLGLRSYGGRRAIDLRGRGYSHTANQDTWLIAQIETERGLEQVEEIASVPGVDVIFFGPDDMAMQSGMAMDQPRKSDTFKKSLEKLAAAAEKYGKVAGTVAASAESLAMVRDLGYQLIVATADAPLLATGSAKAKQDLMSVHANPEKSKRVSLY